MKGNDLDHAIKEGGAQRGRTPGIARWEKRSARMPASSRTARLRAPIAAPGPLAVNSRRLGSNVAC